MQKVQLLHKCGWSTTSSAMLPIAVQKVQQRRKRGWTIKSNALQRTAIMKVQKRHKRGWTIKSNALRPIAMLKHLPNGKLARTQTKRTRQRVVKQKLLSKRKLD